MVVSAIVWGPLRNNIIYKKKSHFTYCDSAQCVCLIYLILMLARHLLPARSLRTYVIYAMRIRSKNLKWAHLIMETIKFASKPIFIQLSWLSSFCANVPSLRKHLNLHRNYMATKIQLLCFFFVSKMVFWVEFFIFFQWFCSIEAHVTP